MMAGAFMKHLLQACRIICRSRLILQAMTGLSTQSDAQVTQLTERCVNQLAFRLTVDNFAETALLADRVSHQGLHEACVAFALLDENRCANYACPSSCIPQCDFAHHYKPAARD